MTQDEGPGWGEAGGAPPRRVLIAADDALGIARARDACAAAGAGVAAVVAVAAAADALGRLAPDALMVELYDDPGAPLDTLLAAIERAAAAGTWRAVVVAPLALLDIVLAGAPHPDVQLLSGADPLDRAAALALALVARSGPARAAREGRDVARDLQRLGEETARIAAALAGLASGAWGGTVVLPPASGLALPGPERSPAARAARLRAMIRERRLREAYFPADLFADPAWDMLLDLAAARLEGRAVAVTSLCIAAAVPPTTALRWIKTLTEAGMIARIADETDGRRVLIELSRAAADGIDAYLAALDRRAPG